MTGELGKPDSEPTHEEFATDLLRIFKEASEMRRILALDLIAMSKSTLPKNIFRPVLVQTLTDLPPEIRDELKADTDFIPLYAGDWDAEPENRAIWKAEDLTPESPKE